MVRGSSVSGMERSRTDGFDARGDDEGFRTGGVGKDDEKFVAPEAAEEVVRAQTAGDCSDDIAEGGVAGGMSSVVVDGFEVVDIDEGDGDALSATPGSLEFEVQLLLNAAAVEDTGEEVPFRFVFDESEKLTAEHE